MSTVIIFGASGLLGASLVPALRAQGHVVLTQGRGDDSDLRLDPSDRKAVATILAEHRPETVVNLVAATNVDQCETQPGLAWLANAEVAAAIAGGIVALSPDTGLRPHLVQLSTDQLYEGTGPHAEDRIRPINVYGLSKYTGELLAARAGATVLRTNFFGRSRCPVRASFSDWLVQSLREQIPITVFDDVKFSAVHIDTLCDIISRCIMRRPSGVFNAGCRDGISKAGFALALADELDLHTNYVKIGVSTEVSLKARRPIDMTMKVSRLEAALDIICPVMLREIKYTAKEYLNE